MSFILEVTIQIAALLMSVAALVVSVALWYRDKYHFRGPDVTLANQTDHQHSVLVPFTYFPQSLRDLFPDYGDRLPCVVLRAVWLNTGDRAGFIHTKKIHAIAGGRSYRCAYYSYIEVAAGSAVLQPIIVRNLPADDAYELVVDIEFAWQRIWPDGRKMEDGRGTIQSRVKPADAPPDP
jgi:hypothetical protein